MIYLFFGEDRFSLNQEVKKIKSQSLPPEAEDFNFARIDALKSGFGLDEVINACEAYPFLSDKRVVVVTGLVQKLGKSAVSEERAAAKTARTGKGKTPTAQAPRERFIEYIPRLPATTVLLLVEEKTARNDLIYKAVDKHGAVRDFTPLDAWGLQKWVNERAAIKQMKLERTANELLVQYCGADLYRLDTELDKLAAFAGEGKPVTMPMVERMTAQMTETKIWAITDALTSRNLQRSLDLFYRLRDESEANEAGFTRQMFAIVAKQIYNLIRVKEMYANRKTVSEIASALAMAPFQVEKMLPLTRSFGADELDRLYSRLTQLDHADKTGKLVLETQLDVLLADICLK
jgi:DNA polymerase III subunit delta